MYLSTSLCLQLCPRVCRLLRQKVAYDLFLGLIYLDRQTNRQTDLSDLCYNGHDVSIIF